MNKYLVYFLVFAMFSACIPAKKTTYFQGDFVKKTDIYKLNNEPYRLQVNDIISIDIKAENQELVSLFSSSGIGESYYSGYSVDRHGNIRIPYLGDINVLGYTEKEVRKKIETELANYLKDKDKFFVTVKLSGIQFVVTGEVGSPGTKNLAQNQVSIIEALTNAGEVSEFGNRKKITIIRKSLDGVQKFELDMTSMDIFNSEHFYIQPNDIIHVYPYKRKTWGFGSTGLQTFTTIVSVMSFLVSSVLLVKNI